MGLSKRARVEVEKWITVEEAAKRIGVTSTRVRQLVLRGELESLPKGIRVDPRDLGKFAEPRRGGRQRSGAC